MNEEGKEIQRKAIDQAMQRKHQKPDMDSLSSTWQAGEACEAEIGRKKNSNKNEEATIDEEQK